MSHHPGVSRIETSLPPAWKRRYATHLSEEDDGYFADGPDPLVHIVPSRRPPRNTHYGPSDHYGSGYPRMDFARRETIEIPESAPPLPYSSRRRESHISYDPYPVAPVHERVRHVKRRVVAEPESREALVVEKDIEVVEPDTPRDYRRDFQVPVVERHERPVYTEATYSDFEDENHVFYSFGDLLQNGSRRDSQLDGSISDIESTVAQGEGNEGSQDATERGAAAYHVLKSQYAGDGYEAGHHSAKLTAVLSERAAVSQSLFRWIEKNGLQKMITGVKRDHTKTVQASDGKYARYLEPKLRHEPLLQDGKPAGSQAVTWVSLPYFSLEPYSGLLATANSPKSLATPTLLQARYSRTRRARDMEQAVCQQGGAPKGHCFHVAQLWCLVLDNSLLLTYGRIDEDVLCADIITKTVKPLHKPPDPMPSKTLSVRFQGAIMWSIPVHECQTWFPPALVALFEKDNAILGATLPTHNAAVSNQQLSVTLPPKQNDQRPGGSATAPVPTGSKANLSASKPDEESGYVSKSGSEFSLGIFAYLECFNNLNSKPANPSATLSPLSSQPTFPPSFQDASVVQYFADMEEHIQTKTTPDDQRAYKNTYKARRAHVVEVLGRRKSAFGAKNTSLDNNWDFGRIITVFHSADIIFSFFFPAGVSVPTTRQFWGAVMAVINVESDIVTKHSDRRIEQRLGLLEQELSIIDWTVELQRGILDKMLTTRESVSSNVEAEFTDEKPRRVHLPWAPRRRAPQHPTMAAMAESVLDPSQPCGFSDLLLREGIQELTAKRSELKLMGDLVEYLTDTNRTKIDYTKDRQERAIYAFTIVTVIFLPLSAVASIFGMNSADVRDMELGQWAYWATALPVTGVVMFLGLLFTGELGTVRRWVGEWVGGGGGVGTAGGRWGRGRGDDGNGGWGKGVGEVFVDGDGGDDDEGESVGRGGVGRRVRGVRRRRR
ncbi:hypothetical protein F5144DRAFT_596449 [Chaetomium tenue]|uniref:Uncharacterized protein n=1 Tax=Chaetomium tenue TaxID=1854479 RepID=A0ACB7NV99_9PEZI|nr:hypothetical protein F5144DRAFT_596449 [Chaetomium globosum]